MSHTYLFILGRTPELSFFELRTVLPDVERIGESVAVSAHAVPIGRLGGTIKIAEIIGNPSSLSTFIKPHSTFGISVYGEHAVSRKELEELKRQSGAARFIEPRHGSALSSVVVEKNHVDEFIIVNNVLAKTIAVQPFEEWAKRDFGRPYADAKSGMLPPKVARMLVNIAGSPGALLDPFCGMGTIVAEAYLSGWRVMGSDHSPEMVRKAKSNLDWLGAAGKLFVSDATHVSDTLAPNSIHAIVTEPFMGNVRYPKSDIRNLIKGLEKLYIGCLRDWKKILVPEGLVIIALPEYAVGGNEYFVKKVIDMCETLGYTIDVGPIAYSRPQAIVRRMFYKFQKI